MRLLFACLVAMSVCAQVEAGRCRSVNRSRVVTSCCTSQVSACCANEPTVADAGTVITRTRQVTEVRASDCAGGVCRTRTVTKTCSTSQAQVIADRMATIGSLQHDSGGLGAGSFEGVGMGATREEAIANCCFWGQRIPADIGAAQSVNGRWFAAVIYR